MNHCNSSCSSKCKNYKIPTEAVPLPSLSSDEDSFVVLWRDTDTDLVVEVNREPVCVSIIDEAKQLIAEELNKMEQLDVNDGDEMEQSDLKNNGESKATNSHPECDCSVCYYEESASTADGAINKSIILPEMPELNKGCDAPEIVSIATLSSELTPEQVQNKVSEIVDENIRLKDTILQNNISMKSQYERILAWQEDVQKVHQAHKEKILEAKDLIEKLKKENFTLTRELEKLKTLTESQQQEVSFLKQALRNQDPKIQEKLKFSVETNVTEFELEVALKQLKVMNESLAKLTKENCTLKEDNAKLVADNISKSKEYVHEIDVLRKLLNDTKRETGQRDDRLYEIQKENNERVAGLSKRIFELEESLHDARTRLSELPTVEEVDNMRQQLATTQINLTNNEQAKKAAYQRLEYLNEHNSVLLLKLKECQNTLNEMYAVKTQMELYKSDFEEEKAAKETLKIEKEKLSEDMKNLQRRNQQLQEEIDLLRENEYVIPPSQNRHSPSAPLASSVSTSSSLESPPLRRFACPICNLQFRSLKLVEEHVDTCIAHPDWD